MDRSNRISKKTPKFIAYESSKVKIERPIKKLNLNRLYLLNENDGVESRWKCFYKQIVKFLGMIVLANSEEIVHSTKREILVCFERILEQNEEYTQWPVLNEADKEGNVEINHVYCSVCGLDSTDENNDLLFCDYAGCNRVYHKGCLIPCIPESVNLSKLADTWFCWQCETIDRSLNKINAVLNLKVLKVIDLFPEVRDHSIDEVIQLNPICSRLKFSNKVKKICFKKFWNFKFRGFKQFYCCCHKCKRRKR